MKNSNYYSSKKIGSVYQVLIAVITLSSMMMGLFTEILPLTSVAPVTPQSGEGAPGGIGTLSTEAPTINGLFYGDGDYQRYSLLATSSRGTNLYGYVDGTSFYVALVVHRNVNDNVFNEGRGASLSEYVKSAGWNQAHLFNRLIDSEYMGFTLTCGSNEWTWQQGYADQPGGDYDNTQATWFSDHTAGAGEGTPPPGYVSSSSMVWNLNNYASGNTPSWDVTLGGTRQNPETWQSPFNPDFPDDVTQVDGYPPTGPITFSETYGWEWPMVYEFSVDLSICPPDPITVTSVNSHHSPVKDGGDEDDPIIITDPLLDWGDLPSPYPTLAIDNGPRHNIVIGGAYLGTQPDPEGDGQPHPGALGDDLAGKNDEDGITFLTPLVPGREALIEVEAGTPGYLSAWIDFNGNGNLTQLNLLGSTGPAVVGTGLIGDLYLSSAGTYVFRIEVPEDATGVMYSRWRFTNEANQGGNSITGLATTGEVEDYALASLGDFVWLDLNGNGIQDVGEPGVEGVTVRLLDSNGEAVLDGAGDPITTITDQNGYYEFPGVIPGVGYRVKFEPPAGYLFTLQNQGDDPALDSDPDPVTGVTDVFVLIHGQFNDMIDAGLTEIGAVIGLDKQATLINGGTPEPFVVSQAGDVITYTFTATNTGFVPLTNVEITDPLPNLSILDCGDPGQPTTLQPDESLVCTATYVVDQDDVDAGVVDNTAMVTGEDPDGDPVEDEDDESVPAIKDADIQLVKEADKDMLLSGETITYTFTATNTGNVTLTNVLITDPLPNLSALDCGDPGQPTTLQPDQSLVCTATYVVTQADVSSGSLDNTATVTGEDPDGEPVQDEDDESVPAKPDLTIEKTNDAGTPLYVGDTFTWTIVVSNADADAVFSGEEVVLSDALPAGASYSNETLVDNAPLTDNMEISLEGNLLTVSVAAGESVTLAAGDSFTVTVDVEPTEVGTLENTAVVDPDDVVEESNEENNEDTDSVIVEAVPLASIGDFVWLDLNGDGLQDPDEPGIADVTVNLLDGDGVVIATTETDVDGMYLFEDLAAGTYAVQFELPDGYAFTTQDADGEGITGPVNSDADPNTGGTAQITVGPGDAITYVDAGLVLLPDLMIEKTNDAGTPLYVGDTFTWTIIVSNADAESVFADGEVVMSDTLPGGALYSNPSGPDPAIDNLTCGLDGMELSCAAEGGAVTLAAGDSFTVTVDVEPTEVGTLENTAVVDPDDVVEESNEENNEDTDSVIVEPAPLLPDLTIEKTNDAGTPLYVGDTFTWTIVVSNADADAVFSGEEVVLSDALPAGASYSNETLVDNAPLTDNLEISLEGNLLTVSVAVGESVTLAAGDSFTVTVDVEPTEVGTLENTAVVDPDDEVEESNEENNEDTDSVIVEPAPLLPDLTIEKTNDAGTPLYVGDTFTWTIVVSNRYAASVFADGEVVMSDTLPGGALYTNPTGPDPAIDNLTCGLDGMELSCAAEGGAVTLAAGDNFTVTVDVEPLAAGVLENTAVVDPDDVVEESNEENNEDTDSVFVEPVPLASIGDFVWLDLNGDGLQDPDEPGIADVTVNLLDGDGVVIATTVTDVDGMYLFEDLTAGTYVVQFELPDGYAFTTQDADGEGITGPDNSDADPNTGETAQITVGPGDAITYVDAGLVLLPDLTVEKTNDAGTPLYVGDTFTWTIVVSNADGDAVFGGEEVVLSDALPAGASYSNETLVDNAPLTDNLEISLEGNLLTVSVAAGESVTLAAGDSFTVTVDVEPTEVGTLENTAVVDPDDEVEESNEENNEDTDSVIVDPAPELPDLTVEKTNDAETPLYVGDMFTWTIVVSNRYAVSVFADGEVVMSDTLPGGALYTNPTGPDPAIDNLTCGLDGMELSCAAAGGAVTLAAGDNFTVTVDVEPLAAGVLENTAVVDPDDVVEESNEENNEDTDSVTVGIRPEPDIQLVKEADKTELVLGETITYTFTATNTGNVTLSNVIIDDPLEGLSDLDCDPDQPAVLLPGAELVCTATYIVTQADLNTGSVENVATVTGEDPDGEPVEDEDDETIISEALPDIDIVKVVSVDGGATWQNANTPPGPSATGVVDPIFRFTVTNTGNVTLEDIDLSDTHIIQFYAMVWINNQNTDTILSRILDTIPAGTTYKAGSLACEARGISETDICAFDTDNNRVVWEGTIGPDFGATNENNADNEIVITFRVVVADNTNTLTNQGSSITDVDGDGSLEDDVDNPEAQTNSNIVAWERTIKVVDLEITKSVNPTVARIGDTVTYTLQLTNKGNETATQVVVTDPVSSFLDILSVTTTKGTGTFSGRTATFNIGSLAPNETVTMTIRTRVNNTATATVDTPNVATVSHLTHGVSSTRNSNVVYVRILGQKTLPDTGAGPIAEGQEPWLIYILSFTTGLILFATGLVLCILSDRLAKTFAVEKKKQIIVQRVMGAAGIFIGGMILALFMVSAVMTQVLAQGAQPQIGYQAPGVSQPETTQPITTELLPSGERMVVVNDPVVEEEPLPVYDQPELEAPEESSEGLGEFQELLVNNADRTAIQRIIIPALGVNQRVDFIPFDGYTWPLAGIREQVAWLGETSAPGLGSNTVLAGHVTLTGGSVGPFDRLDRLQPGDTIILLTGESSYTYSIQDSQVVENTDVFVTEATADPIVTLITCENWDANANTYLQRLVVVGALISVEPYTAGGG